MEENNGDCAYFQLEYTMPIDLVYDKTLEVGVWNCDRLSEKSFLGGITIPLKFMIPHLQGDSSYKNFGMRSKYEFGDWYRLENTQRLLSEK